MKDDGMADWIGVIVILSVIFVTFIIFVGLFQLTDMYNTNLLSEKYSDDIIGIISIDENNIVRVITDNGVVYSVYNRGDSDEVIKSIMQYKGKNVTIGYKNMIGWQNPVITSVKVIE